MYGSRFTVFYGDTIQITNPCHLHYGKYATVVEGDLSVELMFTGNSSVIVKEHLSGKRLKVSSEDFKVTSRSYIDIPEITTYRLANNGCIYSIRRLHENSNVFVVLEKHNDAHTSERVCRSREFIIDDLLANSKKYVPIDETEFNRRKNDFIFGREMFLVKVGNGFSMQELFNGIIVKGNNLITTINKLLNDHPSKEINVYSLNGGVLTKVEYSNSVVVMVEEK